MCVGLFSLLFVLPITDSNVPVSLVGLFGWSLLYVSFVGLFCQSVCRSLFVALCVANY